MLTPRNALNAAILLLLVPAALCQMAPLPSDRLEPVSGLAGVVSNPDKRSAAFDLLERARWNYNLHAPGREPFSIKLSFVSSGQAALEGTGTMEETWVVPGSWRWTASFANTAQVRVGNSGEIYGTTDPVPLRVQMVRAALFWPINFAPSFVVRSAHVKFEGEKIDCLLLSGSVPGGAASRFWVETEYCVDPKTGLLKVWSEAPGIYTIYDYADAPVFHGHTLPRQITVHENGDTVLKVRIENIEDARDVDPKLFQPTPEMIAQGPSFTLSMPTRFPIPVDPDPGTPAWIQPVIVHATIGDYDGQVLDAETAANFEPAVGRCCAPAGKEFEFRSDRNATRGFYQRAVSSAAKLQSLHFLRARAPSCAGEKRTVAPAAPSAPRSHSRQSLRRGSR